MIHRDLEIINLGKEIENDHKSEYEENVSLIIQLSFQNDINEYTRQLSISIFKEVFLKIDKNKEKLEPKMAALICLIIACKFDGVFELSLQDLVKASSFQYSIEQFISSEITVLKIINFRI